MRELSGRYPVWFCDIWGVVHDGRHPHTETNATLARHRRNGGVVILVSNSPRSHEGVEAQLRQIGVDRESHDDIVTSGDVTRALMQQVEGGKLFHLGPERDISLFRGLGVERVPLAEASAVVCSGLFDDASETPDLYDGMLAEMKARKLPMICANPDKVVRVAGKLIWCAGALAENYERLGGQVLTAGKPHAPIYDLARRKAGVTAGASRENAAILAIGDGPETDVLGAGNQNFPCVYVTGGVRDHTDDLAAELEHIRSLVPKAEILKAVRELAW